jgi:phage shock protein A
MTDDNKEFIKNISSLRKDISELRQKLNELDARKEAAFEEKKKISEQ